MPRAQSAENINRRPDTPQEVMSRTFVLSLAALMLEGGQLPKLALRFAILHLSTLANALVVGRIMQGLFFRINIACIYKGFRVLCAHSSRYDTHHLYKSTCRASIEPEIGSYIPELGFTSSVEDLALACVPLFRVCPLSL